MDVIMANNCEDTMEVPRRSNESLTPISSGEEKCAPGHSWGPGVRANYLIHYIISGKGLFYCGTNKYVVEQGTIFVIFPGTIVKYQADAQEPWHYTWINCRGEEIKEVLNVLGISLACPVLRLPNGEAFGLKLRSMPRERSADLWNHMKFSACLYEAMALLLENIQERENSENAYLTMAKRYIGAHYYEEITIEQVAAHMGISRKYLFAIFKKTLGISPKEYLVDYRMRRAKEFLADRNLPIGHIAYSVGYRDQMAFSKIFKLKTGLSPSEYRGQLG